MSVTYPWGAALAAFKPAASGAAPASLTSATLTSTSVVSTVGSSTVAPRTDYDGDGKADLAVFSPSTGTWSIRESSTGTALTATLGVAGDKPVPGDYDGDGKTDVAIYRPATGEWYVLRSSTNALSVVTYGARTRTCRCRRLRRRRQDRHRDLSAGDRDLDRATVDDEHRPRRYHGAGTQTFPCPATTTATRRPTSRCIVPRPGLVDSAVRHEYDDERHLGEHRRPPDASRLRRRRQDRPRRLSASTGVWSIRQSTTNTTRTATWGSSSDIPCRPTTTATARPISPCIARAPASGRFCCRARTRRRPSPGARAPMCPCPDERPRDHRSERPGAEQGLRWPRER